MIFFKILYYRVNHLSDLHAKSRENGFQIEGVTPLENVWLWMRNVDIPICTKTFKSLEICSTKCLVFKILEFYISITLSIFTVYGLGRLGP